MNGIELARQILEINSTAQIILYTSATKEEIEKENHLTGNNNILNRITFIQKDIYQLVQHLKDYISGQLLADQLKELKV